MKEKIAERFSAVLRENFENGFRPDSMIDRNRFKQYCADLHGTELAQSDEEIVQILYQVATLQDERIFIRDGAGQSDLLDDIQADIAATFKDGASCICYSERYAKYQDELAAQLQVFSQDVMKELLVSTFYGEYRTGKH